MRYYPLKLNFLFHGLSVLHFIWEMYMLEKSYWHPVFLLFLLSIFRTINIMSQKIESALGKNSVCIECFPKDNSELCTGFANRLSKYGLAHPDLNEYWEAVLIFNVLIKFIYIAKGLDHCVHAGLDQEVAIKYFESLIEIWYKLVDSSAITLTEKEVCTIAKDEIKVIMDQFFIKYGTSLFYHKVNLLFEGCRLDCIGKTLLDLKTKNAKNDIWEQSMIQHFGYTDQFCNDKTSLPGLNLSNLATKSVKISIFWSSFSLDHHLLHCMTLCTHVTKHLFKKLGLCHHLKMIQGMPCLDTSLATK